MGILHFNPGNVNLLENLAMPASIIVDNGRSFSNRAMDKCKGLNNNLPGITLATRTAADSEYSISICRRKIGVRILNYDDIAHMVIGIQYNKDPGYMVLYGLNSCSTPFKELLRHMEITEGIKKVLLVDDNQAIIETYQSILQLLGYETFQFTSPAEALESMEPGQFDLLISDYDMPGMNGLELLKNFYSKRPGLPVIIISGSAGFPFGTLWSEYRGRIISFINKPATMNDLNRSLEVVEFFYKLCSFSSVV